MVDMPTPEAPAQLQGSRDFEDKDLKNKDLEPATVPADINLIEGLLIEAKSLLEPVIKHTRLTVIDRDPQHWLHCGMLQCKLLKFINHITELLSDTDDNYKWTEDHVCFFHVHCQKMKTKWNHLKRIVQPVIKEDDQKPVIVSSFSIENNKAPKKRRT